MQLQNGAGGLGLDGAEEAVLHGLSLPRAVAHQQHPLGLHDGADAHGVGLRGNVLPLGKEPLVGVDGGVGELHMVGALGEGLRRLVEADVTVGAQTQQLQIRAAKAVNDGIVPGALGVRVRVHAIGDVAVGLVDIHMIEQVRAHKIGVALVMLLGKTHILVQIHGLHPGEVQIAGLILGDQLLVGAHRAGAGGQTQHAVGLQINLGGDDIGGFPAHVGVILGNNQSHRKKLLSNLLSLLRL